MIYWGSDQVGGRFAERRALEAGYSAKRARVLGHIGSFPRDGWAFRAQLAKKSYCSVRTAQRGITQAKADGFLKVTRSKPDEIPDGASGPFPRGFSHRLTVGKHLSGAAEREAVNRTRADALRRRALRERLRIPHGPRTPDRPRGFTAEQREIWERIQAEERAELEAMAAAAIAAADARAGPKPRQ